MVNRDVDFAAVSEVDQSFHCRRVDDADGDLLLLALGHVVGEHGVEVGDRGGQDDAVGVEQAVIDLKSNCILKLMYKSKVLIAGFIE